MKQRVRRLANACRSPGTSHDPGTAHIPPVSEEGWQVVARRTLATPLVTDAHQLGGDRKAAGSPSNLETFASPAAFDPHVGIEERHPEHTLAAQCRKALREGAACHREGQLKIGERRGGPPERLDGE